jgi:nucleoid DNA-binding protein
MTKADLIKRVASRKEVPRDLTKKAVAQLIDAVFSELGDFFIKSRGLKPAKFSYPRFGTFSKRRRRPRNVRNPQTGRILEIPEQVTIVFSPGQDLRDLLTDAEPGGRGSRKKTIKAGGGTTGV